MGLFELILIAAGLAMDAFAVSMCKGLAMPKLDLGAGAVIALWFGGFQALMPAVGYLLGSRFERYISSFDHWIAFALLMIIGIKMIAEALKSEDGGGCAEWRLDHKELFLLAVATSIDALAVGITLACLKVDIVTSSLTIGVVTFLMCFAGVAIGNRFGERFKRKSQIAGGAILCVIGIKILLEHTGIIG